jgi:Holliday junction resolvase RusA-like endonuclease
MLTIFLPGKVVPCARPIVGNRGAHYPKRYQKWKDSAYLDMLSVMQNINLVDRLGKSHVSDRGLTNVSMIVTFYKSANRGSDLSNLLKSIEDVCVSAGLLHDDSIMHLRGVFVQYRHEPYCPSNNQSVARTGTLIAFLPGTIDGQSWLERGSGR